jgi:hypothetical protein
MILYHFTSSRNLHGIARYGLTVGDVPSDIERHRGRVGVWLTSAETAGGHGLEGSAHNKKEYRLTVEVPDDAPQLVKWSDWLHGNVTDHSVERLHTTAPGHESWYIFFGVIPPDSVRSCTATATGAELLDWGEAKPWSAPGTPAWRRDAWQRQLLKRVKRTLGRASHPSAALVAP